MGLDRGSLRSRTPSVLTSPVLSDLGPFSDQTEDQSLSLGIELGSKELGSN